MLSVGDAGGGRRVHGVVEGRVVTLVAVSELASGAVEVVYRDDDGRTASRTVGHEHPALLDLVRAGGDAPDFGGDPRDFLLASAALVLSRPARGGPTSAVPPPADASAVCAARSGLDAESVEAFFLRAFERLGGRVRRDEGGGHRIVRVPGRLGDAAAGLLVPRLRSDEGGVEASSAARGHPLLGAVIEATLADLGDVLRRGAVFIDRTEAQADGPVVLHAVERTSADGAQAADASGVEHLAVDAANVVSTSPSAWPCRRCSPPDPCERDAIAAAVAVAAEPWVVRRRVAAVRSWAARRAESAGETGASSVVILSSALVIPGRLLGSGRSRSSRG